MCESHQISEYLPIISGVPHWPLLYILSINDIFDSLTVAKLLTVAKPFSFADNIKLLMAVCTLDNQNLLQHDLHNLATWNNMWHLLLNTSKCSHIHYHFSNSSYSTNNYNLGGNTVDTKHNIKDLGITFSTNLHWDSHYTNVTSKAYEVLYLLQHTVTLTSIVARKRLYLTLVRSQLLYCSPLWRPHLIKDIMLLEQNQRQATYQ